MANKFDILYAKRAFIHWHVGSGLEEGYISCAREDLEVVISEYEDYEKDTIIREHNAI